MAFVGDTTRWPSHTTVHVVEDAALAQLLRSAGPWTERAGLASAATPGNGATTVVTVLSHHAGTVSEELAALLNRTPTGTPGRDALARAAAHLGVVEAAPEPEPAAEAPAEPEPAPVSSF